MPIDQESSPWPRFIRQKSWEAFVFTLGHVALFAIALVLIVVMPVAIGLAWYQFRRSYAVVDFVLATAMTFMLPFWQNALVAGLGEFLSARA